MPNPISPVIPGLKLTEAVYAKNQPQYRELPTFVSNDGMVTSRWKLTWRERLLILFHGNLWVSQLTFGDALQPIMLNTTQPLDLLLEHEGINA